MREFTESVRSFATVRSQRRRESVRFLASLGAAGALLVVAIVLEIPTALVVVGVVLALALLTAQFLLRVVPSTLAPERLETIYQLGDDVESENVDGAFEADFVALGLGGTGMMAMLWSVAHGRRAVGVELRGDPSLGVHWNLREELYHHLAVFDEMMIQRYGPDRIPKFGDGRLLKLAEIFYTPDTGAGAISADEVISSFDDENHIAGRIHHLEFIDDRWAGGEPHRHVTVLDAPPIPDGINYSALERPMREVLDGPSTFQCGAAEVLIMLRRYLEAIEELDLKMGLPPRVRIFTNYRVVATSDDVDGYLQWFRRDHGFVKQKDGRQGIRIEKLRELDYRGKFHRVRHPGSKVLDLGVPELFMIAQGFSSDDAARLGFVQRPVKVDHNDGRGEVVAQSDYLAGLLEVMVDGRLRRRISSVFDNEGAEYWVRQLAVGHENDPEVGWTLVQVPDFKTFDPVLAGLVPRTTPKSSAEYKAASNLLMRDFFLDQASDILEISKEELAKVQLPYGPKLFSLVEVMGDDAIVARNGVVAGDSFGNGHFLTSGGVITGMLGHAYGVKRYWEDRDGSMDRETAIRRLADKIKTDTEDWLAVSATEFSQAAPINFGTERIAAIQRASGRSGDDRSATISATRRHRHTLVPLNPSDWRRFSIHRGRVYARMLPPIGEEHPDVRMDSRPALDGMAKDAMMAMSGEMDAMMPEDAVTAASAPRASATTSSMGA